jgi:HSP20 family protein
MRYRRLSYRYAVVMASGRARALGEAWQRQPAGISMGHSFWRPPTDVVETASEVIVLVELAGVDHEQLDVLLFEDALIVEGERRLPAHTAGVYHAAEIRQGQVRLELPLPASIDPEQVDARYERGLLEMRLGKRSATRERSASIPIGTVVDATAADPSTDPGTDPPSTRAQSTGPRGRAGDRERENDGS